MTHQQRDDFTRGRQTLAAILRHDTRTTTYKIALIRAINDVALAFPEAVTTGREVAVPLRRLAAYWIAYYWPFVQAGSAAIAQGPRARRGAESTAANDLSFRPALTTLRQEWENVTGGAAAGRSSDGFFLLDEMRLARRRAIYPASLHQAYEAALRAICTALHMPIRHAGPAGQQWSVFAPPTRWSSSLSATVVPVPGIEPDELCLVVSSALWTTFQEMSLWIEALCIHEWALFTERLLASDPSLSAIGRGGVYALLTDRPDNRRLLTWERNQVDILLLEGTTFTCPWTLKRIMLPNHYDLDHLVPLAIRPLNALWNLVPADPAFNQHVKRDRLPSGERLAKAEPYLAQTYKTYNTSRALASAVAEDLTAFFSTVPTEPSDIAQSVAGFITAVRDARTAATF